MSIEILSSAQKPVNVDKDNSKSLEYYLALKNKSNKSEINVEKTPQEVFAEMKISNHKVDAFLNDNEDVDTKKQVKKKEYTCTKCKGSKFEEQDELRKHFKTNWHNFNAKQSAHVLYIITY